MRRITHTTAMVIITALTFPWPRTALSQMPPSESLDIRQVALFKNGLGFFVGQVTCPEGPTSFQVALPVAPSHGTFWISYPADLPIAGIVARQAESGQMIDAITVSEILKANPGRKVRITIGDTEVTGVIRYVAGNRDTAGPDPYLPPYRMYYYQPPEPPQQGGLLIVETDAGELSVDPRMVTQAMFLDGKAEKQVAGGAKSAILHVRLKAPAPNHVLTVSFLAKGITWAPSYLIDITDASQARLSAKALIVNDAFELKGVDAQLVTGFPHLQFADIASPLALKQNLAQFLQALSARREEPRGVSITSNIMTQSVAYNGPQDQPMMPDYSAAEIGQAAEDLFLYPAGRIDLGTREVAYLPLFTETIPYRHIHQWDIPDYVSEQDLYRFREEQPIAEEVWHSIRLTNTTRVPWTTAPGETVKNGTIIGQDTLHYTPPRTESTLRITRAIGVKAEQREFEVDRRRGAVQMYGSSYDLITVRGDLSIVNIQEKTIDIEITKNLSGEVKSTDPNARIEKLAVRLRRMNGRQKITWPLQLNPGEKKDVNYTYEVYIRQ